MSYLQRSSLKSIPSASDPLAMPNNMWFFMFLQFCYIISNDIPGSSYVTDPFNSFVYDKFYGNKLFISLYIIPFILRSI